MTYAEAFVLVAAGQGRWTVQHRGTSTIAGEVWRTHAGFELRDLRERAVGVFETIDDGLRFLLRSSRRQSRNRALDLAGGQNSPERLV